MNLFKQIRQAAGMTLSEMAAHLAVDSRTVRRYEDGTRTPGGAVRKLYGLLNAQPPTDAIKDARNG